MLLPKHYQQLESLPSDPPMLKVYGTTTESFKGFIKVFPISEKEMMPFNKDIIIEFIHECIIDSEGLIECDIIKSKSGADIIYTLIKCEEEPSGASYLLRVQYKKKNEYIEVDALTKEEGMTGIRDATIFESFMREKGDSKNIFDGWSEDPYDKNFKKGFLMNKSEAREYDEMFPNHPLSEIRRLLSFIADNN